MEKEANLVSAEQECRELTEMEEIFMQLKLANKYNERDRLPPIEGLYIEIQSPRY